jgi:hypothetical protein
MSYSHWQIHMPIFVKSCLGYDFLFWQKPEQSLKIPGYEKISRSFRVTFTRTQEAWQQNSKTKYSNTNSIIKFLPGSIKQAITSILRQSLRDYRRSMKMPFTKVFENQRYSLILAAQSIWTWILIALFYIALTEFQYQGGAASSLVASVGNRDQWKTMGARCLMGMRLTRPRVRITDERLWKSQGGATSSLGCCPVTGGGLNICRSNFDLKIYLDGQTFIYLFIYLFI